MALAAASSLELEFGATVAEAASSSSVSEATVLDAVVAAGIEELLMDAGEAVVATSAPPLPALAPPIVVDVPFTVTGIASWTPSSFPIDCKAGSILSEKALVIALPSAYDSRLCAAALPSFMKTLQIAVHCW